MGHPYGPLRFIFGFAAIGAGVYFWKHAFGCCCHQCHHHHRGHHGNGHHHWGWSRLSEEERSRFSPCCYGNKEHQLKQPETGAPKTSEKME